MTIDSRIPDLLLDLAELKPDVLDEWQSLDMLVRFKERATDILKVWPPNGFAAIREIVSEVAGTGTATSPVSEAKDGPTRKDGLTVPAAPHKMWEATISTTRDPSKAAPGVNLGLKCNRLPEK